MIFLALMVCYFSFVNLFIANQKNREGLQKFSRFFIGTNRIWYNKEKYIQSNVKNILGGTTMNKLRNKLYKYEFRTVVVGAILFIMELKLRMNYPKLVSVLISPLSSIFIYISIAIVLILMVLEMLDAIKNRDFDILFFILIILAGLYLMYRII